MPSKAVASSMVRSVWALYINTSFGDDISFAAPLPFKR
jgi:hypothetical protein